MAGYRILSLDGGGPWALIQVMALIDLYGADATGHTVLKKFDLIAANSGGALTLGGLLMDWPLSKLLDLFLDQDSRDQVFVPASFFDDPIAHLTQLADFGPKYSARAKYNGLRNLLGADGDRLITDVPAFVSGNAAGPHILFCAFDYDANREVFFRSDANSLTASLAPPLKVTIAQAIHASANPPLNYFDAPASLPQHRRFWDGAVGGYNNPVLAAAIEAIGNAGRYGTDVASIKALSLGTGNVVLPPALGLVNEDSDLVASPQTSTILADLKKMASSILDDPPDAATFHTHMFLGGDLPTPQSDLPVTSPVVRLNPLIQPVAGTTEPWTFPSGLDRQKFTALRDLPMDAHAPDDIALIQTLGQLWLANDVPNQPVRANAATLRPEIGCGRYGLGKQVAQRLFP